MYTSDMDKPSIFFAYSYDVATKALYANIKKNIKKNFKDEWIVRYGPVTETTPPSQGKIEKFRTQNKQLFELFVKNIQSSSIVIADITNSNSNVMIEIGIAIKFSKNILIVSGESKERTPFNISGYEIQYYKDSSDLKKKIRDYLATYKSIKNMTFEDPAKGSAYAWNGVIEASQEAIHIPPHRGAYRISPLLIEGLPRMKDLKIRVEFRIVDQRDESDWFGLLIRSVESGPQYESLFKQSILVNSRVNGKTDLTLYPGETIEKTEKINQPHDGETYRKIDITLENERISVKGDIGEFHFTKLENVNFGVINLACFRAKVEIKKLQILCIDTISEI